MTKSPKHILRYVLGLIGVFVVGFVLLLALHSSFMTLLGRFDQELENERSRIAIGEEIIANINQIERNFYQLVTSSTGSRSVENIYSRTEVFFDQIDQAFAVFKNGGTLTVTIRLNQPGIQDFARTITYIPPEKERYVLEIIDLRPKVLEIRKRMQILTSLIVKRNNLVRSGDQAALEVVRDEISLFLKKSPSHFVRLHENANGLYYQGHHNLERLKGKIAERKARQTRIAMGLMASIISGVLVICGLIVRQIYAAHSQLEFVSQEMEKAKKDAETAQKIKTDFLATMGHEIRTPMNIIVGMTGLALDTQLTSTQQRYLSRIQNAADILLGLLDDILDFSKIEDGQLEIADQPFDLKEIIYAVAEVVKMEARQKGLTVAVDVAETPWVLGGDPVRLRQILLILANNAVKFTEQGQVAIEARLEELDAHRLLVVVSVRDTGIGIAKEQLATIFDTFAQADTSVTRKYGGTGLGLAICNQLAKLMGGEITVDSEVGQGSTFTISLPMTKVSSSGEPLTRYEPEVSPGPVKFLEILLVENDGSQQEIAEALLAKAGHRVNKAANGLEALHCMAKFQYDVVFLVLDMPVLGGRATALDIRAFERGDDVDRLELGYDNDWLSARLSGQHTFLVAVSAKPRQKDKAEVDNSLFDHHICKPYGKNLVEAVNRSVGLS